MSAISYWRLPCTGCLEIASCDIGLFRVISYEAILRKPAKGNLHDEKAFTIECSRIVLDNHKTRFEHLLMCYQSDHILWIVRQSSKKNNFVQWNEPTIRRNEIKMLFSRDSYLV